MPMTTDDEEVLAHVDYWQDVDIEMTLDSGCCNHVLDVEDAPGYTVQESPGSRRGQNFIVGNGDRIPNEGQVRLNMESKNGEASIGVESVFQVAEVSRPLMSVSKICKNGFKCVFDENEARVVDTDGKTQCVFKRKGGLYISTKRLKAPTPFIRPE